MINVVTDLVYMIDVMIDYLTHPPRKERSEFLYSLGNGIK
jgi:hypothetical protein